MEMIFGIVIGMCYGLYFWWQQVQTSRTFERYYRETAKDVLFWREMYCNGDNAIAFSVFCNDNYLDNGKRGEHKLWQSTTSEDVYTTEELYKKFKEAKPIK